MRTHSTSGIRARLLVGSIALIGAVLGAFLVLFMKHQVDQQWHWPEFIEDLIRNFLVVGFVSAGTLFITESEGRRADAEAKVRNRSRIRRLNEVASLAASAWNVVPDLHGPTISFTQSTDAVIAAVQDSVKELRELAAFVDRLDTDAEQALFLLGEPQRNLFFYAVEGKRARRFEVLQHLADELAVLQDVDATWSESISVFRRAARIAIGWRSHTDATIIERLLVESRVSLAMGPRPKESDGPLGQDIRANAQIDPLTGMFEPFYVLVVFLTLSPRGVGEKADIVRRCLHSWRNEMLTIAEAHTALVEVLKLAEGSYEPANPSVAA
jgi:hypothetical protein